MILALGAPCIGLTQAVSGKTDAAMFPDQDFRPPPR
jgi:hypothetical protein